MSASHPLAPLSAVEVEAAVALVKKYDGEYPDRFSEELLQYLSLPADQFPKSSQQFEDPIMDRAYFDALANRFRPAHLWQYENNTWRLRRTVFDQN